MDSFGHVNNVVFLRYLEEARIDLFFRVAREATSGGFESGVVVARHEIDYRRPLTYRAEPVTIEMWVTRIGAASLTVAYEVKDVAADGEETLYVRAATVLVPYDLERGRPRRLGDEERIFAEKYLEAAGEGGAETPSMA
ncbi:acyl-CoA thioesterase [Streptomyces sp. 6N223]|uniref:acyl-CoA thioesterase n=1 Tax=Streptomyces sp. 6N223 TaxID=3457412 RepID=UPI003FD01CD1